MSAKHKSVVARTKAIGFPTDYATLLQGIKQRIRASQVRATLAANAELIRLYWDIGYAISRRQQREGWGRAVIPRLARDLHNELPEVKGFSERNIDRMVGFYRVYPTLLAISPPPVAKLHPSHIPSSANAILPTAVAKLRESPDRENLWRHVAQLPWAHNVLLVQKIKDLPTRVWYMQQAVANGWSRNVLALQIDSGAHLRVGKAITNFAERLPPLHSDLATQILKDPYIFDFLTLQKPFHERELETGLLIHVQKFLLELGQGFAFVGRQYHLEVGAEDFYVDLLFYHLHLRCFIVIDLKKGPFRAEYAGKMNFYCNVLDDKLRHKTDQPTIGLILCQDKNRLVAEYALKGLDKAIGVSEFQLTRALPRQLQSSLPTIRQIEMELSAATAKEPKRRRTPSRGSVTSRISKTRSYTHY
jgi:predicted nuclease of restriction endonuclease-like (RecB) superfamily